MVMEKLKIAGIGELLWDVLPEEEKLGGAPINFVYHVCSSGADGIAISTIGYDSRGNSALSILQKKRRTNSWNQQDRKVSNRLCNGEDRRPWCSLILVPRQCGLGPPQNQ